MKRGLVGSFFAVSVVMVLWAPSAAIAKGGPSQGVITGAGLVDPIRLREPGSSTIGVDLASVVKGAGFFAGVWGGDPDRLTHRPDGDLGPRYTIIYRMTLSRRHAGTITQFVFPYAEPLPVTYTPAKQRYWRASQTVGGWFVTRAGFRQTLIGLGLPTTSASPSTAGSDVATATVPQRAGSTPWLLVAPAGLVVALAVMLIGRRPRRSGQA